MDADAGKGFEVGLNPAPPPLSEPAMVKAMGLRFMRSREHSFLQETLSNGKPAFLECKGRIDRISDRPPFFVMGPWLDFSMSHSLSAWMRVIGWWICLLLLVSGCQKGTLPTASLDGG